MTDEQINEKIAEACGYVDLEKLWEGYHKWRHPNGHVVFGSKSNKYSCLPNYCNDLNAMHEAEQQLRDFDEWVAYDKALAEIAEGFTWHATARQRAEAFLRTLNLWEE